MAANIEELKKQHPPFEVVLGYMHEWSKVGYHGIPAELVDLMKWHGIYPQRPQEDGYLMMRVKIQKGAVNGNTLRTIAGIAEDFGRDFLDVTDRQAFQFHWLTIENVPEIYRRLDEVGLTAKGACGDTVRAVISSPVAGLDAREVIDVNDLANEIHHHFSGNVEYQDLPRKYKVSITGLPEQEGIHLINDLGFLAHKVNGEVGFDVWVGGGLGAQAHLAKRLGVFIKPEEVLEVAVAITRAYRDHGYRQNRKKSRLKYLIQDIGAEKFREIVETEYLNRKLTDGPAAPVARFGGVDFVGVQKQKDGNYYIGVATTVGRITPQKARLLADIAEKYGADEIRTTPYQNLLVPHIKPEFIDQAIEELRQLDLAPNLTLRATTIACTGTQFCRLALTETKARTAAAIDYLEPKFLDLDVPITINLTGCSNACTRYQVADLGFMGSNFSGQEVFQVHLAGSLGEAQRTGIKLKGRVLTEQLHIYTERVLNYFKQNKAPNESFVQFVDRVGTEPFLPDNVLAEVVA